MTLPGEAGITAQAQPGPWRLALMALVFAEVAGGLESTLMFAALPAAMRDTGGDPAVSWLISAYLLVSAAAAAASGRLADMIGRQRMLVLVLALATSGSAISIFSDNLYWMVGGRALQGVAGAVLPLCFSLLRETLPTTKVPFGIGLLSGAHSLSAAAGFIIGGIIVDNTSWHHIFTCSGLVCATSLVLCVLFVPHRSPQAGKPQDLVLGLMFVPAVLALIWAISRVQSAGVSDWTIWLSAGVGFAIFAAWGRHEWRHPAALIDLRLLLNNRRMVQANLAVACASLGALQILQVFPLLLQQPAWTGIGFGIGASLVGLLKLPSNVASAAGATLGGALCARFDSRYIILAGAFSMVSAWIALWMAHDSLLLIVIFACFSSAGFTTLFAGAVNIVVEGAPDARTGEVVSQTVTLRTLAQSIGVQCVIALFASSTIADSVSGSRYAAPAAFDRVFAYMTAISALAVAVALLMPRREHSAGQVAAGSARSPCECSGPTG